MLEAVWAKIERDFEVGDVSERRRILKSLESAAFFQPARTLNLIRTAISDSDTEMLRIIPRLLVRIAHDPIHIHESASILWELGKNDSRRLNSYPDHPIRVLQELAEYDIGKSVTVHERLLDVLEKLILDVRNHTYIHSPFDALEPLLARSGMHREVNNRGMTLTAFGVSRQNTAAVRDRALDLIARAVALHNDQITTRAIASLEKVLSGVQRYLDLEVSSESEREWDLERIVALKILQDAALTTDNEGVRLAVLDAVRPYTKTEVEDAVRKCAIDVLSSIPISEHTALLRELREHTPWNEIHDEDEGGSEQVSVSERWKVAEQKLQLRRQKVVDDFVSRVQTAEKAIAALTKAVAELRNQGVRPEPSGFLAMLAERYGELATEIAMSGLSQLNEDIISSLPWMLFQIRRQSRETAISIATKAAESIQKGRFAAAFYLHSVPSDDFRVQEINLLEALVGDSDDSVRAQAAWAIRALEDAKPKEALRLARKTVVGTSTSVAKQLFMMIGLDTQKSGLLNEASDDDLKDLITKLESVSSIDDHFVERFISFAARRVPEHVVKMLIARIERKEAIDVEKFTPLPYEGPDLGGLAQHKEFPRWLQIVRDRYLLGDSLAQWWLARLYQRMSVDFESPIAFEVLDEWVNSGVEEKIMGAATIFGETNSTRVFESLDWVVRLIRAAAKISEECVREARGQLFGAVISGGKTGTPGKPFPKDLEIKAKATAALEKVPNGSPEWRFFEGLVQYADREIRDAIAEGDDLDD